MFREQIATSYTNKFEFIIVNFTRNLRCQEHQPIREECFGAVKNIKLVLVVDSFDGPMKMNNIKIDIEGNEDNKDWEDMEGTEDMKDQALVLISLLSLLLSSGFYLLYYLRWIDLCSWYVQ
ncbi:hypothetical protein P3L10_018915 [Capsicum annuum]